jgi:hypothetical protein
VVVVVMMMVVVVLAVMMMTVVLVMHRSSIGAGRAEDRHGDSEGHRQPESGEEGLLHDIVSFCAGRIPRTPDHIGGSSAAIGDYPPGFFRQFFPTVEFCFWIVSERPRRLRLSRRLVWRA